MSQSNHYFEASGLLIDSDSNIPVSPTEYNVDRNKLPRIIGDSRRL